MQRFLSLTLMAVVIVSCSRAPEPDPDPNTYWACGPEGGLEFATRATDAGISLTLPGRTVELAAAGDGRYAKNEVLVDMSAQGETRTAVVRLGLESHQCQPKEWGGPWAEAAARGVAFRAVGQEPGWYVEVVPDGELTAVLDYGERRLELPAPDVTPLDGGARGYQAERDGVVVQVVIEPLVCFDAMSGQVYPETVTLAHGGQRYSGCGKGLAN